jgi:glycosyltransferase involved in cell wall biosynthesis
MNSKVEKIPKSVISFHPRKQHNFEQAAVLAELYPKNFKHITSVYFAPTFVRWVKKILPRYGNQIGKRSFYKLPKKYVKTLLSTEIRRWLHEKKNGPAHLSDYMNLNEYWQKTILKHFDAPDICISYDGISHLLFRQWKYKSVLVLDLAIGLPQYRVKIEFGENFHLGMLDEVDEVRRKLFAWYKEEIELSDIILCGSEFVKETVVYFFPEYGNKCKILPYGTNLEEFSYPERKFTEVDNIKFVFVGRLSWRKGAHQMLDAWRDFVKDHPCTELHFFGTADKEIILDDLPERVFLHGWTRPPELISQLKAMDVFVFPTTFEGSSIAVFQAMALKLPIITTVNSGTILKHGDSCEIVEVGDRKALVNSMDKLFRDREYRQKIADNGYALSKNYSWEDYKHRLAKILDEINI